ncbi:MAG: hypothetical protein IPK17_13495 [Chloroflexi bacterium]|uniref:hypothetical protein n=1 Tax=Candidatus Flexifilum breve TaxID=3140694 RepID=UPI0031354D27|nr:hypothetical protein [Chloroflexota bacterium]
MPFRKEAVSGFGSKFHSEARTARRCTTQTRGGLTRQTDLQVDRVERRPAGITALDHFILRFERERVGVTSTESVAVAATSSVASAVPPAPPPQHY